MKVSIQLRKFGKKDAQAKLYFRVRDDRTGVDIKAASSLSILPEFWDSKNTCYKTSTPTDIVSAEVQKSFNEKVALITNRLYDSYYEEANFLWLTTVIGNVASMEKEASKAAEMPKPKPKPKKKPQGKTDKTMLDYFQIYLDTSNFNAWHHRFGLSIPILIQFFITLDLLTVFFELIANCQFSYNLALGFILTYAISLHIPRNNILHAWSFAYLFQQLRIVGLQISLSHRLLVTL